MFSIIRRLSCTVFYTQMHPIKGTCVPNPHVWFSFIVRRMQSPYAKFKHQDKKVSILVQIYFICMTNTVQLPPYSKEDL